MDNKIFLDEYLLILKSNVEVYVHGTLESSNSDIKKLLKTCLIDTIKSQEDTYNLMTAYGYYKIKNINQKEIESALNTVLNSI